MAKVDWDQGQDKAGGSFEVLPKGRYACIVASSEDKSTKDGKGRYLEFKYEVVKGDYTKRLLWARFNVHNPSEVAQQIGREQFKALCVACGFEDGVKKTEELHNKKVVCLVDIERGTGGYQDKNVVSGYMAASSFTNASEPVRAAPAAAKATATADTDDDIPF